MAEDQNNAESARVPAPAAESKAAPASASKGARGAAKRVSMKVSAVRTVAAEDREADKKSLGQVRKTVVFLGFVAIAYALYLVLSGQVDEFVTSLAGVDLAWIVAGVACFMLYYVFGVLAYVLSIIADPDNPVGIRDLMSVGRPAGPDLPPHARRPLGRRGERPQLHAHRALRGGRGRLCRHNAPLLRNLLL